MTEDPRSRGQPDNVSTASSVASHLEVKAIGEGTTVATGIKLTVEAKRRENLVLLQRPRVRALFSK